MKYRIVETDAGAYEIHSRRVLWPVWIIRQPSAYASEEEAMRGLESLQAPRIKRVVFQSGRLSERERQACDHQWKKSAWWKFFLFQPDEVCTRCGEVIHYNDGC
jgi:hypothetical protein